uniref:NADH-ubiquinone oxidoreductase chain 5 n=1 Tax=Polididus armatissimus TaxID=1524522 RepID=A0A9E9BTN8_9HEMI|nr:NADH dehydrogenase subunit 5 [Polididus armatissimus]WAJ48475.1 NADH dehydrogenase subunit 5 [Polididus armatissimus]
MLNKVSLYLMGSFLFLFTGVLIFFWGIYFLIDDYTLFLEWEIASLNSSSIVMTLLFDSISLMFTGCVFVISSMVIMYSESYMSSDDNKVRFYFLVFLFVLSMMMMIISPNLMSILIGWDGLGLVSYCLVIFFQNYSSYSAGMLTVLTNRLGDVAILLAIAWMLNFGSWNFIFYMNMWEGWMWYFILLIVLAGFTKSAQIPFSAWLPAAMAAPTPVSALVHSSTLVTAGVYLLIRFSDVLMNIDCSFLLLLSMLTMFMSGLGASFEYDLKKVIALSTLSQLGLMMSILFIGYPMLAFFHLLTHAFFKALLFMCAGLMIHCMNDTQDIRYMGSVVNHLPFTCSCFFISNMSLCGAPFMSGFYSKDLILEMMTMSYYNFLVFFIFFVSVGLTVSYSTRLMYYCVSFNNNCYVCQNYFEDTLMMKSMLLLSLLAIVGGSSLSWLIFNFPDLVMLPFYLKIMPLIFVIFGGFLGYELAYISLSESVISLYFYNFTYFLGSMWFIPMISTYFINDKLLILSKDCSNLMESGWGEYIVSRSSYNYFSMMSRLMGFIQFNNIKTFMLVFLFILFITLI